MCPLCPSASYQIPGHSNPSNLPASISPITSKATPNPCHVFKPKVPAAPNKRDRKECILILGALVFSYSFVCEALSNSECFAPSIPHYHSHNVGIRALLCLFFICFFIALLLHQSVTVRDFGILLTRGRGMAQKLYNQLIITIYTRNTSHSSNGTLNFV